MLTHWGLQDRKWCLEVKCTQTLSCLTLMTHNDVVASWQQLLCHEGDLPELGSVSLVINKRMAELWQLRDTKSAVSENPRAFPGQLIGYVGVNVSPKWEDRHLWCLSSEWVGVEAGFVGEWVTIRGWVTGWIKSKSPYSNPWRHGVRKSGIGQEVEGYPDC